MTFPVTICETITMSDSAYAAGQHLIAGFDGTEPPPKSSVSSGNTPSAGAPLPEELRDARQVLELTNRLQDEARGGHEQPLLVAIDQEQGRVVRIAEGVTLFPAMGAIARGGDAASSGACGGREPRTPRARVNWNLAPVVDVLSAPGCPIGDAVSAASRPGRDAGDGIRAGCRARRHAHVRETLPSRRHGQRQPPHRPVVRRTRAELDACDLAPFRAVIDAGSPALMTAHITFPALDPDAPASLSQRVIGGLLRRELAFGGVVVADDSRWRGRPAYSLETSAIAALRAGSDLLIVSRMLLQERDLPASRSGFGGRSTTARCGGSPRGCARPPRRMKEGSAGRRSRVAAGVLGCPTPRLLEEAACRRLLTRCSGRAHPPRPRGSDRGDAAGAGSPRILTRLRHRGGASCSSRTRARLKAPTRTTVSSISPATSGSGACPSGGLRLRRGSAATSSRTSATMTSLRSCAFSSPPRREHAGAPGRLPGLYRRPSPPS